MGSIGSTIGRVALAVPTLGASEILPRDIKGGLTRGLGAGLTLGATEGLDLLTKNSLKGPTPPDAIKPAQTDSPSVQQAVAEASARRSRARGYASTILSQSFAGQGNTGLKPTFGS